MLRKPVVYIAAPFTSDPWPNTVVACETWERLYNEDIVLPICPHWSFCQEKVSGDSLTWDDFMTYDIELIGHTVDAILRLPGESPGADMETEYAEHNRIAVFHSVEDLYAWVERHWAYDHIGRSVD